MQVPALWPDRGHPRTKTRTRRRSLTAVLMVLALSLVALVTMPATAGDGGRVDPGQVISGGATAAGHGHYITGVTQFGSAFLGPLPNPTGGWWWSWCIQFGLDAPPVGAPVESGGKIDSLEGRALGWLTRWVQEDPSALGVTDPWLSNAAVSYLVHLHYEEGTAAVSAEARKTAMRAAAWPALLAEADRLWGQAARAAETGAPAVTYQEYDLGLQTSGSLSGIGMKRSDGTWIGGLDFTMTLNGPAVFDVNDNGVPDPGETNAYVGTTTEGADVRLNWAATGSGDVGTSLVYRWTPESLAVLRSSLHQNTLTRVEGDPINTAGNVVVFEAELDFQPTVTTQVTQQFVDAGQSIPDQVTVGVQAGDTWIAAVTDLLVEGTLYGPYPTQMGRADSVPADAPVAGTASVRVNGPGTVTAGPNVPASNSGYFTWVWRIVKANQSAQVQPLIRGDYSDGFFEATEVGVARMDLAIASDVPVESEIISKGGGLRDVITIASVRAGDLWLAPGGSPLAVPFVTEVAGPFASIGEAVPADVVPVVTHRWTANQFGTYPIDLPGTLDRSGIYTIRTSVDAARITEADRQFLSDAALSATDGWWAPAETVIVRLDPVVTTEVSDRMADDLPVALVDNVTVGLRDPGDVWFDVNGSPVAVDVANQAFGPYLTPRPETDAPGAGDTAVGPAEPLTFTGPGTQATGGATQATARGFYTWYSQISPSSYVDGASSRFWEVPETVTLRHRVEHHSMVRDYSVDEGDRAFDTITIGGLPDDHGTFAGLEDWAADLGEATVTLYRYSAEPSTVEVPADAEAIWSHTYPAINGTLDVGYTEVDKIVIPAPKWSAGTWYQFVYSLAGSDRVAPYASAFNDVREQMYDAPPDTYDRPRVVTQAQPEAAVGEPFSDTALVIGTLDEGMYLGFEAYGPQAEDWEATGTPVCSDENSVLDTIADDDAVMVPNNGYYTSPSAVAAAAGDYLWVETLYSAEGQQVHRGDCGQPGETTRVVDEPERPWVATIALVTADPSEDEPVDAPAVGDFGRDQLRVGGVAPEGSYAVSELFYTAAAPLVCSAETLVGVSERLPVIDGQSEYVTSGFELDKAGRWGWVETLYGPDGAVLDRGECGHPDETFTVTDGDGGGGGGGGGGGDGGAGGELATTGVDVGIWIAGALLLVVVGAGAVLATRWRAVGTLVDTFETS